MVLARLKIFILKKRITVFVVILVLNADEIWMNGNWFYTTEFRVFGDGGRATERSPTDNLT